MKTEILSPAGSMQGAVASILNGANAIYMGTNNFNARRNAKNFTNDEIIQCVKFAHARGVKVYVVLNTLLNDREFVLLEEEVKFINNIGVDAVIVQDLGVAEFIKSIAPKLSIHASTQLVIHNLDGALFAKDLGLERVVLSRELTLEAIEYITKNAGLQTEVFVHGALCMSYSGGCYISSIIGQRSGNRGLCAQPCRLPFSRDIGKKDEYLLSLKDLSLIDYILKLRDIGVSSLKIEGRMKRAEYAGAVTDIYSRVLRENRLATADEKLLLEKVFSRTGFTDGYATGDKGEHMFGVKTEYTGADEIYKKYQNTKETPSIPLNAEFIAKDKIIFKISDDLGNEISYVSGDIVHALSQPTQKEQIIESLSKTGGTPFYIDKLDIDIKDDIYISKATLNLIRRECINKLIEKREKIEPRNILPYIKDAKIPNAKFVGFTISVLKFNQITEFILENAYGIYVPLFELVSNINAIKNIEKIICIIPKIYNDRETNEIYEALAKIKTIGINKILCTNVASINIAKKYDFIRIGDYSLNIFNSLALKSVKNLGFIRQTLSFELMLSQIRDINKCIDTEIIVYGYLPLMIFENCRIKDKKCVCKIKQSYLYDRNKQAFPLIPEFGCRNTLLNCKKLCLKDDYKNIGIKYARLNFTIEDKKECENIFRGYIAGDVIQDNITNGLYYRGVK